MIKRRKATSLETTSKVLLFEITPTRQKRAYFHCMCFAHLRERICIYLPVTRHSSSPSLRRVAVNNLENKGNRNLIQYKFRCNTSSQLLLAIKHKKVSWKLFLLYQSCLFCEDSLYRPTVLTQ